MDKVIRKSRLCHQQLKIKSEGGKLWKNKDGGRTGGGMKKQKPLYLKSVGRDHRKRKENKEETLLPAQSHTGSRLTKQNNKKNDVAKEPLRCWGVGDLI